MKRRPLTDEKMDDLTNKMIQDRVKRDLSLAKKKFLFGPRGPQPLTIETGPWSKEGLLDLPQQVLFPYR